MKEAAASIWLVLLALGFVLALSFSAPAEAADKRHRVIEFDDELVEGLNKRPLDSLSQIGERERNEKRPHLYRKRVGFRQETQLTLREMRYSP